VVREKRGREGEGSSFSLPLEGSQRGFSNGFFPGRGESTE